YKLRPEKGRDLRPRGRERQRQDHYRPITRQAHRSDGRRRVFRGQGHYTRPQTEIEDSRESNEGDSLLGRRLRPRSQKVDLAHRRVSGRNRGFSLKRESLPVYHSLQGSEKEANGQAEAQDSRKGWAWGKMFNRRLQSTRQKISLTPGHFRLWCPDQFRQRLPL